MPAFWVHRERVGERGLLSDNCMNSNSLILSFSQVGEGTFVCMAVMQIHVLRIGTAGISLFMDELMIFLSMFMGQQ
jgi:hypothetical protein